MFKSPFVFSVFGHGLAVFVFVFFSINYRRRTNSHKFIRITCCYITSIYKNFQIGFISIFKKFTTIKIE